MAPELFELFGVPVRGYGLCIGVGILLCTLVVQHQAPREGVPGLATRWVPLLLALAAAAWVGGKLAFWWTEPAAARAILERQGWGGWARQGFTFYGSLLACVPTAWLLLRLLRLPLAPSLDVGFLGLPLLHACGRVGCFLAGCCYGCRYDGPLAVTFTRGHGLNGAPLFPVQLLEAGLELALFAWLWFVVRRRPRYPGEIALTWLALYAVLRFVTELLRGDGNPVLFAWRAGVHAAGDAPRGPTAAQVTALVILAVVVPLHLRLRRQRPVTARTSPSPPG